MTGRSLNILSGEEPSLSDLWGWYEFQRALIGDEKGRLFDALNAGVSLPANRYIGRTHEELKDAFAYQKSELDQLTILGLLTATEASLRIDFVVRVRNRRKDDLSRDFRRAYSEAKHKLEKIRLEVDVLDPWRKHDAGVRIKSAISQFPGVLFALHSRVGQPVG